MSKAEKTRQFIIEKTAVLFNTKGYLSTSLSDISEATGLTKGSIYGNFENKDEVALAVFQYNYGTLRKHMQEVMKEEYPTVSDQLYALVSFYRNHWPLVFKTGGCPLMNAATEADDTFPVLSSQVKNSFESWIAAITEIIRSGQEKNEFSRTIDAEEYASLSVTLIEGGILLSKSTGNERHLHYALDRVLQLITEIQKNPYH